jgi:hypothetical protein
LAALRSFLQFLEETDPEAYGGDVLDGEREFVDGWLTERGNR